MATKKYFGVYVPLPSELANNTIPRVGENAEKGIDLLLARQLGGAQTFFISALDMEPVGPLRIYDGSGHHSLADLIARKAPTDGKGANAITHTERNHPKMLVQYYRIPTPS